MLYDLSCCIMFPTSLQMYIFCLVLINGRGRGYEVEADAILLGFNSSDVKIDPEFTPYEVFNVTQGKRYVELLF